MKKLLLIVMSATILFVATACDNSAELEQLRKENEELKQQVDAVAQTDTNNNAGFDTSENGKIVLVEQKSEGIVSGSEYINVDFTVKNNTQNDINTLSLVVQLLDKNGNITSTTYPQDPSLVSPGQNITLKTPIEANTYAVKLDSYSYYNGSNLDDFVQGRFDKNINTLILQQ